MKHHTNGWRPQRPDHRDEDFHFRHMMKPYAILPPTVDLRAHDDPIYDQGQLGSCVSNGAGDCWQYALKKAGKPAPLPARLFIYYYGRSMEGTITQDSGLEVRDGLKVLAQYGCCDEKLWPYRATITAMKKKPTAKVVAAAVLHKATTYHAVDVDAVQVKTCLADGYPIVFGATLYDSFESDEVARTGNVPMPHKTEQPIGGHCMVMVGYDDNKAAFLVRNSWGTGWGMGGYCWMPYKYLLNKNLASDFWTVRAVA